MKYSRFFSIVTVSGLSLISQNSFSAYYPDNSNAASEFFPGGSPLIAAKVLGQSAPGCGDSLDNLSFSSFNNFIFKPLETPSISDEIPIDSNLTKVTESLITVTDQKYPPATIVYFGTWNVRATVEQSQQETAFRQASNFYQYLQAELGVDSSLLPAMNINFSSDPGGAPATTVAFGLNTISLPYDVPGKCNNTVNWVDDGSIMPHEIGGHLLTGLGGGTASSLSEPIGDYWGLVMLWDKDNNPVPKIGEWITVQLNGDTIFLRDPEQTAITYPYGLIEDATDARRHHNNGQVLTGALWNLRNKLIGFDSINGEKLADYLIYKLTRNAGALFSTDNPVSTITTGPNSTVVLFSKVRDELVKILNTDLQLLPDDGSYRDQYKNIDKYLIIDAFVEKGIGRFPADNLFAAQMSLHNRGGDNINQFHPLFSIMFISGAEQITANGIPMWISNYVNSIADADIDAPEAWAIQSGRNDVIISVVDAGINYKHPEFGFEYRINATNELICALPPCATGNIWTNLLEIQGLTLQDDDVLLSRQGEIDDYIGWNSNKGNNDPVDGVHSFGGNDHGTKVAAISAAYADMTTSEGMTGVCWNCSVMAMGQSTHDVGGGLNADISNIAYSTNHDADIINLSWGAVDENGVISQDNLPLFNGLKSAEEKNILVVTAAGNFSNANVNFYNSDIRPLYPQVSVLKNIINVTALDENDRFPLGSDNITPQFISGKYTVDLAAPQATFSVGYNTAQANTDMFEYGRFSETSSAAPIVSGALALLLSEQKDRIESNSGYRELTPGEVRYLLLTSVDPILDLKGITVSGGRVNAYNLLRAYKDTDMDGYTDKIENLFGTLVNDANFFPDLTQDHDNDGLSSEDELGYGTIPVLINSGEDLRGKIYPIYLDDVTGQLLTVATEGGNPPSSGDTDGDGVSDFTEASLGSDPANPYSIIINRVSNGDVEQAAINTSPPELTGWFGIDNVNKIWATDEAHSGNRSIKLIKTGATELSVNTIPVPIAQPAPVTLTFSGWSRANNVALAPNEQYTLFMYVKYEDGTSEIIEDGDLGFDAGTHSWQKAQLTKTFNTDIDFILVGMKITGSSTGTVWLDDVSVHLSQ